MSDEVAFVTCCNCGIRFGMPKRFQSARCDDGKSFWCPNGHGQAYNAGKSRADKLAEELSRERQRAAELEDAVRAERARAEEWRRSSASHKGRATKLAKRAAAGVCPCCNRTFAALSRHMSAKHPGFLAEAAE